jgi:hypothetical protein
MTVFMKIFSWSEVLTWEELWAWAEVWALLIPLIVLFIRKKKVDEKLKPVIIYLWVALVLLTAADFSYRFQNRLNLPQWMRNNTSLHNLHSIARLLLFSWFFIGLKQPFLVTVKKIVPALFIVFVFVEFLLLRPVNSFYTQFSSALHAAEAAVLLFYCTQYYIRLSMREEVISVKERAVNWFIAGLTIYMAFNFFIFLFFSILTKVSIEFANALWQVHNISFVVFCCFIAKAFYDRRSQ